MAGSFKLSANWQLILHELGLSSGDILRRAKLSTDLLARENAFVSEEEYFRLFDSLEAELGARPLGLEIGSRVSLEAFDPLILAMISSPDMNIAAERLCRYKRLIGPLKLDVSIEPNGTVLKVGRLGARALSLSMGMLELVFFVQFIRRATKSHITPLRVVSIEAPRFQDEYEDYFGVRIKRGPAYEVVFSATDASKPFLTANAEMWRYFEPVLSQRLAEIEREASTAERVHAALYELLPSGRSSILEVSSTLGMSTRSLQRRLTEEETTYKQVLNNTREQLARYYLGNSQMTAAEIAFLLGFDEATSFFRAFRNWTGQTPKALRASLP